MLVLGNDIGNPDSSPLRLTTWPLGVLTPGFDVTTLAWEKPVRKGEWIFSASAKRVAPPEELHLRLSVNVDATDLDAVRDAYAQAGGTISAIEDRYQKSISAWSKRLGHSWSPMNFGYETDDPCELASQPHATEIDREWHQVDERINDGPDAHIGFGRWCHVDTISWQLEQVRMMGALALATSRGVALVDVLHEMAIGMAYRGAVEIRGESWVGVLSLELEEGTGADRMLREDLPVISAMRSLDRGLGFWYPRVWEANTDSAQRREIASPNSRRYADWFETDRLSGDQPNPLGAAPPQSLIGFGALQTFNDLVGAAVYTSCAHCRKWYGKQVGRAKHQSRKKGVIYCSRGCANAASQAAYRARQKAKKQAQREA